MTTTEHGTADIVRSITNLSADTAVVKTAVMTEHGTADIPATVLHMRGSVQGQGMFEKEITEIPDDAKHHEVGTCSKDFTASHQKTTQVKHHHCEHMDLKQENNFNNKTSKLKSKYLDNLNAEDTVPDKLGEASKHQEEVMEMVGEA